MNRNSIVRIRGIKAAYYSCSNCGNGIDSYEYYMYGKCYNCRGMN